MQYKVDIDMNHATMLAINNFRNIFPSNKKKGKTIKATVSTDAASKVCPKTNLPFTSVLFDCTVFISFENRYVVNIKTGIVIGRIKLLSIFRAINSEAPTNPTTPIKNIRFQKLSLLSLAAIKPVFSVAEFCIVKALDCFSDSVNVVKSAMIFYCNDWYKTYDLIIAKLDQNLKQIIQNIRVFALRLVEIGRLATLLN